MSLITWILVHLTKFLTSSAILIGLFILYRLRERIALAAGVDHLTVFRWGALNIFHRAKIRAVEVFIWKLEDLPR
jgi:hypothetical protein